MADNLVLGRGELYFAKFNAGTEVAGGERYLGNTPEFNLSVEEEKLEHFSSDRGVREKDASISLQVNRTGTIVTDNIDPENIALFFFGSTSDIAVTGATVTAEVVTAVQKGLYYQLGETVGNPAGARALDIHTMPTTKIIVTTSPAGTTYVEGTDYTIDMDLGRLYIVPGGAITAGANILVTYKTKTSTRKRVISGSTAIKGKLRFVSRNANGTDIDYVFPSVSLSPNGDFALKSDEWMTIPFNLEVLKKSGSEAIYADGRAVTS